MNPAAQDVQLTDEDIQTIKKCRQLSFWRGSVPFTIGSVLAVGIAQNMGFFANRPKLRAPCYVLSVVLGYLGGKVSYVSTCKKMFLELNDSRIKDFILDSSQATNTMPDTQSPLIVNTPVDSPDRYQKPMSYAERREYYRTHRDEPFPSHPAPEPSSDVQQETKDRTPSIFSEDRPLGSYQFDDVYRPRD
ncbi:hypothetical protein AHF37_09856 [Paragonimus kellicotti]|nr:hypothetical protein AHF37_09856 [Paragonimus kellicotti]